MQTAARFRTSILPDSNAVTGDRMARGRAAESERASDFED